MIVEINMDEFHSAEMPNIKTNIIEIKKYFNKIPISSNIIGQNLNGKIKIWVGPFKKYGGSMMSCQDNEGIEIFIDQNYFKDITNWGIDHELLHSATNLLDDDINYFGHDENYAGVDEATTQFFAEEISGITLKEDDCYLWFLTNIIRLNKSIFGVIELANQYVNGSRTFENSFNNVANGDFEGFATNMTKIYHLLLKKEYYNLTDLEEENLSNMKNSMLQYLKELIDIISLKDKTVYQRIDEEFSDNEFLNLLYDSSIKIK